MKMNKKVLEKKTTWKISPPVNKVDGVNESTPLVAPNRKKYDPPSSIKGIFNDDEKSPSRGAFEDVTPTWKETMDIVLPYLWPVDLKHTIYAVLALFSTIIGKLIDILPPLAIKHAVDLISEGTSIEPSSSQESFGIQIDSLKFRPLLNSILVYFFLKVISLINNEVQTLTQRTVSLDAERRFGVATFAHLHHLSLSYHLEKNIGQVTQIMNRGVDAISTFISSFLFFIVPLIFESVVVSAMFFHLGTPWIVVSTLVSIIIYFFFTLAATKIRIKYRRALVEATDAVSSKETETLVNYETVAMFGRSQHEIEQYAELRQNAKDKRIEMTAMFCFVEVGQKFIRIAGISAGLIIAAYAIAHPGQTKMTAGSFVVIQIYINQLFEPLRWLGWQYQQLVQAFTDLEKAITMFMRVSDVKDTPEAEIWKPDSKQHYFATQTNNFQKSGTVVFKDVSFHYKTSAKHRALGSSFKSPSKSSHRKIHTVTLVDKESKNKIEKQGASTTKWWHLWAKGITNKSKIDVDIVNENIEQLPSVENQEIASNENEFKPSPTRLGGVDNINFSITAGKKAALVGASGSGKTTLIRLILRLYETDGGSIHIDGKNVRDITQQSLRENIGVVAQDTILFNSTLRENIIYGKPEATEEEIWLAVGIAALEEFVKELPDGLETLVGERGMRLSGGERQRVGMARCVIKNPQLILLDEATSALDSTTERAVQKNMDKICEGRTTLMIAHRLSTAQHCDQIIVLDKGKIKEQGTHRELLQKDGKYASMWQVQIDPSIQ